MTVPIQLFDELRSGIQFRTINNITKILFCKYRVTVFLDMHCLRLIIKLHIYIYIYIYILYMFFSSSLEIYLLCHLLKSEADQVVITVMEVFGRNSHLDE